MSRLSMLFIKLRLYTLKIANDYGDSNSKCRHFTTFTVATPPAEAKTTFHANHRFLPAVTNDEHRKAVRYAFVVLRDVLLKRS